MLDEPVWDNTVAKKFIGKLVKVPDVCSWLRKDASWGYRHYRRDITTGSWAEDWDSLDDFEKNKISEIIATREFYYDDSYWDKYVRINEHFIIIEKYSYDSETTTAKYLIFAKNKNKVAFITDNIPEDIYVELR